MLWEIVLNPISGYAQGGTTVPFGGLLVKTDRLQCVSSNGAGP